MEEVRCLVSKVSADVPTNHVDSAAHLLIPVTILVVDRIFFCEPVALLLTLRVSAITRLQSELFRLVHHSEHVLRAHNSVATATAVSRGTGACDTIVPPALLPAGIAVHEAEV